MKRILLAFAALAACTASPVLAQTSNVRIVGRDSAGNDRPVLVTDDGRLTTSGTATTRPTGLTADQVQGNVASGTADTGNPVKIGGVVQSNPVGSPGVMVDGTRGNVLLNPNGMIYVAVADTPGGAGSDNRTSLYGFSGRTGASAVPTPVWTGGAVFNGTGWDRQRGDLIGTYTVSQSSNLAGAGAPSVASTAITAGQVLKASPGNLYNLNVLTTTAGYVLLFNAVTVPADGTVTPAKCYALAANSSLDIARQIPTYFSVGVSVAFSTTGCFTKTASATAFISGDVK